MKYSLMITLLTCMHLTVMATIYNVYTDKNNEVNIQYPSSWKFVENPKTVFIFIRPIESVGQSFRENVNLIIGNNHGLSLNAYIEKSKIQLSKLNSYKEIQTKLMLINNMEYVRIIYEHSLNKLNLKAAYYICLHNGKAYQFTCSSTKNNYYIYASIFEKMIKSAKF